MKTKRTLTRCVYVGSVAQYQPQRAAVDPQKTHRWSVFVRGVGEEDSLEGVVEKVVFVLHPTFPNPVRVVYSPAPLELMEEGWGEFDIQVQLHCRGGGRVDFLHPLRLHHTDPQGKPIVSTKPLLSETFEELVFVDPPLDLEQALQQPKKRPKTGSSPSGASGAALSVQKTVDEVGLTACTAGDLDSIRQARDMVMAAKQVYDQHSEYLEDLIMEFRARPSQGAAPESFQGLK